MEKLSDGLRLGELSIWDGADTFLKPKDLEELAIDCDLDLLNMFLKIALDSDRFRLLELSSWLADDILLEVRIFIERQQNDFSQLDGKLYSSDYVLKT